MTILHGVLDLQTKSVRHLIDSQHNSFDRLHMISFDERMDYNMMDLLMRRCRLNNEPRPLGDDDARAPSARLVPPRAQGAPRLTTRLPLPPLGGGATRAYPSTAAGATTSSGCCSSRSR